MIHDASFGTLREPDRLTGIQYLEVIQVTTNMYHIVNLVPTMLPRYVRSIRGEKKTNAH